MFLPKHPVTKQESVGENQLHAIGAGGLRFDSRAGQISTVSPTARHRCDVSSELCSPGAK